ncbi:3557_t:CDS:2, partial [Cetraspora pellucida]
RLEHSIELNNTVTDDPIETALRERLVLARQALSAMAVWAATLSKLVCATNNAEPIILQFVLTKRQDHPFESQSQNQRVDYTWVDAQIESSRGEKEEQWIGVTEDQINEEILLAFISWLDVSGLGSQVQACLNALSKRFKCLERRDLTESFRIKKVVRGLRLIKAQDHEPSWPRNPFQLVALK